jgi:hypothetical protein
MGTQAVYPNWKAPAEDGAFLIWPDPQTLLADCAENHRTLKTASVAIQNIPLSELRRLQRQALGIHDDSLLAVSGHQTELYHPGVWAKDVLAACLKLQTLHIAVDTDQPKHLHLRWPGNSIAITDDPRLTTAPWSGLLNSPTAAHRNRILAALPAAGEFLSFLPTSPLLSESIAHAISKFDESLGLTTPMAMLSSLLDNEPYLLLTHHLLARADQFAGHYNTALAEYRRANNVRAASRPMPDLAVGPKECETPFWLDDLSAASRKRATVARRDGGWALVAGGERFVLNEVSDGWSAATALKTFLQSHHLRLSPRALTLTLYLRLLLADEFIHGIGGGRYDQVTDAVIANFFGLGAPHFCVTTATLYSPAAIGRSRVCLPCLIHEGHRIKHQLLGSDKMALVASIAQLPRRSARRQTLFNQMRQRLQGASDQAALRDWESRLTAAKVAAAQDRAIFDRELFYALQPRDRLAALIERYRASFDKSNSKEPSTNEHE